jgi:hypothetical protein
MQGPSGGDGVSPAIDLVHVELHVFKPSSDKINGLAVAIAPPKTIHRVLEVNVFGVNLVGLIFGEVLVILFENIEQIHRSSEII